MAVKLGVTFILALILSEMLGKNCLVRAAFGLSSHAFCHFIIVSSSNSLYIVLLGILLYVIVFSLSLTAAFANCSASSFPMMPTWVIVMAGDMRGVQET